MPIEKEDLAEIITGLKTDLLGEMNAAVTGMGNRMKKDLLGQINEATNPGKEAFEALSELLKDVEDGDGSSSEGDAGTSSLPASADTLAGAAAGAAGSEDMLAKMQALFEAKLGEMTQASSTQTQALQAKIADLEANSAKTREELEARDRQAEQLKMQQAFVTSPVAKSITNPVQFLKLLELEQKIQQQDGKYGFTTKDKYEVDQFVPLDSEAGVKHFLDNDSYRHFAAPRSGNGTGATTAGVTSTPSSPQSEIFLDGELTASAQRQVQTQGLESIAPQLAQMEAELRSA